MWDSAGLESDFLTQIYLSCTHCLHSSPPTWPPAFCSVATVPLPLKMSPNPGLSPLCLFLNSVIPSSCKAPTSFISASSIPGGFPGGSAGKESVCNEGDLGSIPGLGRWRRERLPTPVFWPGEFHGLYSPWLQRVWCDWATLLPSQIPRSLPFPNHCQHL